MSLVLTLIDLILHLDQHLLWLTENYGLWVYLILFLIIFCETGLVIMPFLPGDSLLFAVGALAATGSLHVSILLVLLSFAAIIGDTVNYWVGNALGPNIVYKRKIRFIKKEYIEKTEKFYEKYGGKTIIIARFVPIVRTFAPLLAGVGSMAYLRFFAYNVIGGVGWIALFIFGGYFFGNMPFVKGNFSLVIFAIIVISFMPAVIEYLKARMKKHV